MMKQIFEIETFFVENGYGATNKWEYAYIVLGILISSGIFKLSNLYITPFIEKNSKKESRINENKDQHHYRIKNMFYGLIYYSIASVINLFLVYKYNSECMPKLLGGELNIYQFSNTWPRNISTPVRIFFIITIGKFIFLN